LLAACYDNNNQRYKKQDQIKNHHYGSVDIRTQKDFAFTPNILVENVVREKVL